MRIACLILFFFSIFSFAQNTALEIKIDSITSVDSVKKERKFKINYHIENRTNNSISFILNPNSIRSNATSSLSYTPAYRLYQEDEVINADNIFNTKKAKESIDKILKDLKFKKGRSKDDLLNEQKIMEAQTSRDIINSIIKLNPKEVKEYSIVLDWDRNRYLNYFDNEYYLDEKATHYIDLCVNLFKDELKDKLLPADYKKIMEDKTIIKGTAQSNKKEINFKE